MIRRVLAVFLYLLLFSVVVSCVLSVWVGVMERPRYQTVFPGARGAMYWATLLVSLAAAANSIAIALRQRWAILQNPVIGVLSITLIEVVRGPRINEVIVLVACTLSTVIAWRLWGTRSLERGPR